MQEISNLVNAIPSEMWVYLASALGLSALLQKFKHKLELENPKVILFISGVLSLAAVTIPAVLTAGVNDPLLLGQHTAAFLGVMELVYRFVVKPSSNFLDDVKTVREVAATIPETKPAEAVPALKEPITPRWPQVAFLDDAESSAPKDFQG